MMDIRIILLLVSYLTFTLYAQSALVQRWDHASIQIGPFLYVIGGRISSGFPSAAEAMLSLDLSRQTSSMEELQWSLVKATGGVAVESSVVVRIPERPAFLLNGGAAADASTMGSPAYLVTVDGDSGSATFTPGTEADRGPETRRRGASVATLPSGAYLFGGSDANAFNSSLALESIPTFMVPLFNDVYRVDFKALGWSRVSNGSSDGVGSTSLPAGRFWHTFTPLSPTQLILLGGLVKSNATGNTTGSTTLPLTPAPLTEAWVFDTTTLLWTRHVCSGKDMPAARAHHQAILLGDQKRVLIYGGIGATGGGLGDLAVLDTTTWTWTRPLFDSAGFKGVSFT